MPNNIFNQPKDAPVSAPRQSVSGYDFALNYQRHAITSTKIKSFDFSTGNVGTISLGGTANNKAQIYNASNQQLAQIDTNGIFSLGTTGMQYYDSGLGSFTASFGPMSGTAFIQTLAGVPLTINLGGGSGTMNINGTLIATSGTVGNLSIGNKLSGGTATSLAGTLSSPVLIGTATYGVNASTAALAADNLFALQTKAGSVVMVVRSGGTNFFFNSAGTF